MKKKAKKKARKQSSTTVACPYCASEEELFVDAAGGAHQTYIEDCPVCCHPWTVHIEPGDEPGSFSAWVERAQ